MNPKKVKELYKITAEELNVKEDLVRDLTDMYWKEIRKSITDLKHPSIYAAGLGTFNAKSWKLAEIREKYEVRISYNNGSNYRKMAIKTVLENTVSQIKGLEEQLESNKLKKKSIKEKRNEKANNTDMEEQGSDSRRGDELDLEERDN